MATTTSPAAVRAVIIDGPETGQIITLDGRQPVSGTKPSAAELVGRIESRIARIDSKAQTMLAELRQVNAQFKETP